MYFRPAQVKDLCLETDLVLEQCFVLENHSGVLGLVSFQENTITMLHIKEEYYITFLEMIEEYLFMKYTSITLLNPLASINLTEHQWVFHQTYYTKDKKYFIDSQYTMIVHQILE